MGGWGWEKGLGDGVGRWGWEGDVRDTLTPLAILELWMGHLGVGLEIG